MNNPKTAIGACTAATAALLGAVQLSTASAEPHVVTAVSPAVVAPARNATAEAGEGLFTALYFGVGPAVPKVRSLIRDSQFNRYVAIASKQQRQLEFASAVVTELNRMEPGFFLEFDRAVTSGDVLSAETEFVHASTLLRSISFDQIAAADGGLRANCIAFAAVFAGVFAGVSVVVAQFAGAVSYAVVYNTLYLCSSFAVSGL